MSGIGWGPPPVEFVERTDAEMDDAQERADREGEACDAAVRELLASKGMKHALAVIQLYRSEVEDARCDDDRGNPLEDIEDELERVIREADEGGNY